MQGLIKPVPIRNSQEILRQIGSKYHEVIAKYNYYALLSAQAKDCHFQTHGTNTEAFGTNNRLPECFIYLNSCRELGIFHKNISLVSQILYVQFHNSFDFNYYILDSDLIKTLVLMFFNTHTHTHTHTYTHMENTSCNFKHHGGILTVNNQFFTLQQHKTAVFKNKYKERAIQPSTCSNLLQVQ